MTEAANLDKWVLQNPARESCQRRQLPKRQGLQWIIQTATPVTTESTLPGDHEVESDGTSKSWPTSGKTALPRPCRPLQGQSGSWHWIYNVHTNRVLGLKEHGVVCATLWKSIQTTGGLSGFAGARLVDKESWFSHDTMWGCTLPHCSQEEYSQTATQVTWAFQRNRDL